MFNKELFKERLFEQIRFSGKSINQIERELGYPRNAISNYKNGGEPSGTRLVELANYFRISPEYLIGQVSFSDKISSQELFNRMDFDQKNEIGKLYLNWIISNLNISNDMKSGSNKVATRRVNDNI